jgi:hypothetical protein
LRYFLLFLLTTIIYYYQSKFSFFSLILILTIYSFYNFKEKNKIEFLKNLIFCFLLILSSILFAKVINIHIYDFKNNPLYYKEKDFFFKNLFYKKNEVTLFKVYSRMPDRIFNIDSNLIIKSENILNDNKINISTSGRLELILQAKDYLKSNKLLIFIGGGPEFDRYLVNMDKKNAHYKDIANGYINLILTGGLFLFILFILFIFYLAVSIMQMFQKFYKDNFFIFSLFLIIVFLLRALVEKSFTSWGIDMLYFFLCLFYIEVIRNRKLIPR